MQVSTSAKLYNTGMASPDRNEDTVLEQLLTRMPFVKTFLDRNLRKTNLPAWDRAMRIEGLKVEQEIIRRHTPLDIQELVTIYTKTGESFDLFDPAHTGADNEAVILTFLKLGYALEEDAAKDLLLPHISSTAADTRMIKNPTNTSKPENVLVNFVGLVLTTGIDLRTS